MVKFFRLNMEEERIIRGDFIPAKSQSASGTIIICHGFKGFKNWGMFPSAAAALADQWDVVQINFSYNGVGDDLLEFTELERFAVETYSRDLEDLDTVVRWIQSGGMKSVLEQHSDGSQPIEFDARSGLEQRSFGSTAPLFLLGHSRGAGVCLIYALDHPKAINGVISWNGITDVDLFSAKEKEDMRTNGRAYTKNGRTGQNMPLGLEILQDMEQNKERFDIKGRIGIAEFPVVLIQGTEDVQRLRDGSAQLVKLQPAVEWKLIPGGNHTFGTVHPYQGETETLRLAIAETKMALQRMAARLDSKQKREYT
jgi:pimeloyl-ACP methyl ester carboxylesterase